MSDEQELFTHHSSLNLYCLGAGASVFQVSTAIFHAPRRRFQTTTYLPLSVAAWPPAGRAVRAYLPTSTAMSPPGSTCNVSRLSALTPALITPCQKVWTFRLPSSIWLLGGRSFASSTYRAATAAASPRLKASLNFLFAASMAARAPRTSRPPRAFCPYARGAVAATSAASRMILLIVVLRP